MGKTEETTAKLLALGTAAVLALIGVLSTVFSGEKANWQPVTAFLSEVVAAGGAGALSFIIMQQLKRVAPGVDKLWQSYIHIGIAVVLGPLAWLGLIALGMDKLTQEGVILVGLASITTGRQIYAHYKSKQSPGNDQGGGTVKGVKVELGHNPPDKIERIAPHVVMPQKLPLISSRPENVEEDR